MKKRYSKDDTVYIPFKLEKESDDGYLLDNTFLDNSFYFPNYYLEEKALVNPLVLKLPTFIVDFYNSYKNSFSNFVEFLLSVEILNENSIYFDETISWFYNDDYGTKEDKQLALLVLFAKGVDFIDVIEIDKSTKFICYNENGFKLHKNLDTGFYFWGKQSSISEKGNIKTSFTREQLKKENFEMVFENPSFQIKEIHWWHKEY